MNTGQRRATNAAIRLSPAQAVTRRRPLHLHAEADLALFEHEMRSTLPPVWLRELSDARFYWDGSVSPHSVGSTQWGTKNDTHSVSLAGRLRNLAKQMLLVLCSRRVDSAVRASELWLVTDRFSHGYFHWVTDVLPKFELLAASGVNLSNLALVLPYKLNQPYIQASLEMFGIRRVVRVGKFRYLRLEILKQVSELALTGNYRPGLLVAMRNRFVAAVAAESGSAGQIRFGQIGTPTRIYISRAGASRRRLANEEELLPVLERYGISCLRLEDLSFPDQVRLFSGARLIVGLHGAGLTNAMWMSPGTAMLELRFRGDAHNNCYFSLAAALDLDYWYVPVEPARRPSTSTNRQAHASNTAAVNPHLDDALADVELVEKELNRILAAEPS